MSAGVLPASGEVGGSRCVRRAVGGFAWEGVDVLAYKDAGSAPFAGVTRQVLFDGASRASELRYFEVAPGGHSTLERHHHAHAVIVLRGRGRCLVGDSVHAIAALDLVDVPGWTWHQFRADAGEALGFLCMVDSTRDTSVLPTEADLVALRRDPAVRDFLRV